MVPSTRITAFLAFVVTHIDDIELVGRAEALALTTPPHHTLPESLMEAAMNTHGQAIHIVNRRREQA